MNAPKDEHLASRPCLLVAHPDALYEARVCRAFRQHGWEVSSAGSASEVHRLARQLNPALIVLATDLDEESGWLTCSKLVRQQAGLRVFLVGTHLALDSYPFADFVGAAGLFDQEDGIGALVEASQSAAHTAR